MNRSLRKIQTVLDSVQGVEGGLKFDPTTGGFLAGASIVKEFEPGKNLVPETNIPVRNSQPINKNVASTPSANCTGGNNSSVKVEDNDQCHLNMAEEVLKESNTPMIDCSEDSKSVTKDAEISQQGTFGSPPWSCLENVTVGSCFSKAGKKWGLNKGVMKPENSDLHLASLNTGPLAAADDMDTKMEGANGTIEHNLHASSSMTDSSNASGSMMHGSTSSSPCFEDEKSLKVKTSSEDNGSKITVKATYKEDMIRFKFDPSAGCFQLYEEVAKRFKLQTGAFQLKYLDDEEEWVMLVSESDLQECLEIMEYVGTRTVKFLVRDTPFAMGSSGSSNCFLG